MSDATAIASNPPTAAIDLLERIPALPRRNGTSHVSNRLLSQTDSLPNLTLKPGRRLVLPADAR